MLASAFVHLRRHAWGDTPGTVRELLHDERAGWRLVTASGRVLDANLEPGSYVHPALSVLHFRAGTRRLTVVVAADAIGEEGHRALRTRLRRPDEQGAGSRARAEEG